MTRGLVFDMLLALIGLVLLSLWLGSAVLIGGLFALLVVAVGALWRDFVFWLRLVNCQDVKR